MAIDGLFCKILADELNDTLSGARIDKIYEPDKHNIFILIRGNNVNKRLLICTDPTSPRVLLTDETRENPMMPPSFCMLLRKYCSGGKIVSVTCPDYERIIEIKFSNVDELHDTKEMRLIIELIGRYSNVVLVNASGKIIDSAFHIDFSVSRFRELMPARIYEYPPKQDKYLLDEALSILKEGKLPIKESEINRPIEKALLNSIMGFSPLISSQLCIKADIEGKLPVKSLNDNDSKKLISILIDFIEMIFEKKYVPTVYFTEDKEASDFYFAELIGFHISKKFISLSEAIDAYYRSKVFSVDFDNKKNSLLSIVKNALTHAANKASVHEKDYEEGKMADLYKNYGDDILTYAYMIKPNAHEITCVDIYSEDGKEITIALDPSLSATDNAQEYYKKFRKAKRKFQIAEEYLEDDINAVMYLRSLKAAIESADNMDDLKAIEEEIKSESVSATKVKKAKHINNPTDPNKTVGLSKSGKASSRAIRAASKRISENNKAKAKHENKTEENYRTFMSKDGHTIYCGRNNIQNDYLTFKVAKKNDWWFHIKGLPGTHVILVTKANEEMPSDSSILEAAQISAFYSKSSVLEEHAAAEGTVGSDIKAEIDYCPVSHVKKIPKAKPGMVIYEGYYSLYASAQVDSKLL